MDAGKKDKDKYTILYVKIHTHLGGDRRINIYSAKTHALGGERTVNIYIYRLQSLYCRNIYHIPIYSQLMDENVTISEICPVGFFIFCFFLLQTHKHSLFTFTFSLSLFNLVKGFR